MFSITKKVKMKKLCCVICGKYRKIEKRKKIFCSKCKNEDKEIFKKKRISWDMKNVWFN